MKVNIPSVRVEVIAGRERGRRAWRVRFLRSGRVLMWSEYYRSRSAAVCMAIRLILALSLGKYKWKGR